MSPLCSKQSRILVFSLLGAMGHVTALGHSIRGKRVVEWMQDRFALAAVGSASVGPENFRNFKCKISTGVSDPSFFNVIFGLKITT